MLGGLLGGMGGGGGLLGGFGGGLFGGASGMFGGSNGLPGGGSDKGALGDLGVSFKPQNLPGGGIIFADPNEMFMKQQLHAGSQAYGQMRPEMQQAQANAMRGTLQGLDPYNAAMSMMYGGGFQQRPEIGNPMSERMMRLGNPSLPSDQPQEQGGDPSEGASGIASTSTGARWAQPARAGWLGQMGGF